MSGTGGRGVSANQAWLSSLGGIPLKKPLVDKEFVGDYYCRFYTDRGVVLDAHVYTGREAELAKLMPEKAAADTSRKLLCPMPGLVIAISAVVGQEVKAGEPLAIVEAMKMENILRAERDVTIKTVNAKQGDSLQVDAVIMEFA